MVKNNDIPSGHCEECGGTGVINEFYVNHKTQTLKNDWYYCVSCYPNSMAILKRPLGYDQISLAEYNHYLSMGYEEI